MITSFTTGRNALPMAIHAAEAHDIDVRIAEAAEATEALARQFFGPAAYVRRDTAIDRETGDEDAVFEVHYCFPNAEDDFNQLVALHRAFTDAFVRITSPDVLCRIILRPVPTDAD